MAFLELGPRPGRDYTTPAEVKLHWKENRDFIVYEGSGLDFPVRYGMTTSREDLAAYAPDATIVVRYDKKRELVTVSK